MASFRFENVFCTGEIRPAEKNTDLKVVVQMKENVRDNKVHYVAANPPDYRATYTGSALPFAHQQQAFENTPNKGVATLFQNACEIYLMYPNSYYVGLGTVMVPPTLYLEYFTWNGVKRNVSIPISQGVPYRMLTYPMQFTKARKDPQFYEDGWAMPVRTQEQILRDSAYPSTNRMSENFWGLKPPQ